ncbi:MAG: spore coat protein U domain-containing protein [Rhizobiales bacterium]|nr:spore coat protein U domain-containing protein [Hyphomicrobiales bacterium]
MPAVALSLICASPVLAAQLAVNFQARVLIQTSCLVSAGQLNFGAVGTIVGGETAVSTVNVVCSAGTPYTISFSSLSSVTSYNGAMINGANSVAYSANLSAAGGTGPGTHTIDGVLPAQVTPIPALYTDNRTVYLSY